MGIPRSWLLKLACSALGNDRGFIVSRSTFVGAGTAATHWLGDNFSGWDDLRVSIVGMLDFNMFGFPFVGADICGHFGNSTAELCKRWMQLGAFYGFCRNHNAVGNRDQDPASFSEEVSRVSREALETRYWLLPYLYTLFHQVHTQGGTVMRPLHHEFVQDVTSRSISKQFLWGPSLLISPIMEPYALSVALYFPPARWYNLYTGDVTSQDGGHWSSEAVLPYTNIPLHVRGGAILPLQRPALNTTFSRLNKMALIAALDTRGSARGSLFWDDGTSRDTFNRGNYAHITFDASGGQLNGSVIHNGITQDTNFLLYESIDIWGVENVSNTVTISIDKKPFVDIAYDFNKAKQILKLMPQRLSIAHSFTIKWT